MTTSRTIVAVLISAGIALSACERRPAGDRSREDASASAAASGTRDAPEPSSEVPAAAESVPFDSLGLRPEDAAATARAYLAALVVKDWARAAELWAEDNAAARDSASFRRAQGDTTITAFAVGTPGPMGAAAGSRYIDVPVRVAGVLPRRRPLQLTGTITLRRSVVDGATDRQRRWRIMRVTWSAPMPAASRTP